MLYLDYRSISIYSCSFFIFDQIFILAKVVFADATICVMLILILLSLTLFNPTV